MSKEHKYDPNSWVMYIKNVKNIVDRELTAEEYKLMLDAYIKPIPAEEFAKALTNDK